jgi:predicted nucleotidyltransferase
LSRDKLPKEVERAVARLRSRLSDRYPDARAYLFGSYANGTWLEDSDLDILLVSERFSGQSFAERIAKVRRLAPNDVPFEILAYTLEEFERAKTRSVVIQDASTYWRRIM